MPICRLEHLDLFYEQRGRGEPVVFLNGLAGDHLYWAAQLRALAKTFRCLALDNRDVGQSTYSAAPYTIRELAANVAGLLDRLECPPAHVLGLSMGGMIALELALAQPGRVKSLVLVNTLARADDWFRSTLTTFGLIRRQVPDSAAFFDALLPWWVSHRFFEDSGRTDWLRWLLRQNPHPQRREGCLRQLEAMKHHDVSDRLAVLTCPVLILAGEDDRIIPERYSIGLQASLPHAQRVVLPGIGHAPPLEDAGRFNALLSAFLQQQAARCNSRN